MMEPAIAYRSTQQDSSVSAYGHCSVQQREEERARRSNVGGHHLARISSVGLLERLVLIIRLLRCSLRMAGLAAAGPGACTCKHEKVTYMRPLYKRKVQGYLSFLCWKQVHVIACSDRATFELGLSFFLIFLFRSPS
jgi:hypothetical protein